MLNRARKLSSSLLLTLVIACSIPVEISVDVPEPPVRVRPEIVGTRTDDGIELAWSVWEKIIRYIHDLEADLERVRTIIKALKEGS